MKQAHRFSGVGKPYEGLTTIRKGKVDWSGVARLIPSALAEPLTWRKPQRVFVNSMSDLFHHSLTNEEIAAVFGVMAACPHITFQVLTKRPERALEWFAWVKEQGALLPSLVGAQPPESTSVEGSACVMLAGRHTTIDTKRFVDACNNAPWPLPNVWLGTSAENQKTADERIPILRRIRALVNYRPMVLFASVEPLLEDVDMSLHLRPTLVTNEGERLQHPVDGKTITARAGTWEWGLDWVIVGGESGNGARPCDVAWIDDIVRQCREASVPVFVKQFGSVPFDSRESDRTTDEPHPGGAAMDLSCRLDLVHRKGGDPQEWPHHLQVREFPLQARS